jgi:hypothetical protein
LITTKTLLLNLASLGVECDNRNVQLEFDAKKIKYLAIFKVLLNWEKKALEDPCKD